MSALVLGYVHGVRIHGYEIDWLDSMNYRLRTWKCINRPRDLQNLIINRHIYSLSSWSTI